ncbi:hypothetical protein KTN05_16260 [Paracoccus sp. Z118]|uniref:hypothetical protein n=1 Tax=Paracoccus sp. Z118 TaxID=2851017 RepID=UPI001C2C535B|nr:hypothetical protein [Paracoccus sp. Z118]MBV0893365.1 hypothetical protein [Paracoccus sp. Z118]
MTSRKQVESMCDGGKRQAPVIVSLQKSLKHNDAARVSRKELLAWRDHLMTSLSAKTVNDIFHNGTDPERYAAKAQRMSNLIATWLRESELTPEGIRRLCRCSVSPRADQAFMSPP